MLVHLVHNTNGREGFAEVGYVRLIFLLVIYAGRLGCPSYSSPIRC